MNTSKISVLMPIYNTDALYLREAIESILNQTYEDFEFIILNDSPANTSLDEIVARYDDKRIKYLKNEKNIGITSSRNKLLGLAQGEYLAIMNHDDISLPKRFEKEVAILDKHPEIGVVSCWYESIPLNEIHETHEHSKAIAINLIEPNEILHSASIIRKSILLDNKIEYDMTISPLDEYDLFWQLLPVTQFYNVQEVLFLYREHTKQALTSQKEKLQQFTNIILAKYQKKHPKLFSKFYRCLFNIFDENNYKIKKRIRYNKDIKVTKYSFFNITILKKESFFAIKKTFLLGILLSKKCFKIQQLDTSDMLTFIKKFENITLWFDHSLGGGTHSYSLQQLSNINIKDLYIRIQNFGTKAYLITAYTHKGEESYSILSEENFAEFFYKININKVVVNSLVGYIDPLSSIKLIQHLKQEKMFSISYRAHDFFAFCPNITMTTDEYMYCRCSHLSECEKCYQKMKKPFKHITSINNWHHVWGNFLSEITDEIIVFSKFTKNIFEKMYPKIQEKIIIIQPDHTQLRKVSIKPHKHINIAVLGNISEIKGKRIINEIAEMIPKGIKLVVVGKTRAVSQKIKQLGYYKRENLPTIMEKEKIDIVFISSICPETYSYTTSEAISMGLPVACFNIGAPPERVASYDKGLIISEINAQTALRQIVEFVTQQREAVL